MQNIILLADVQIFINCYNKNVKIGLLRLMREIERRKLKKNHYPLYYHSL